MRYVVAVRGRRLSIETSGETVHADGTDVAATLADVEGTPVLVVTIGETTHRVVVRRRDGRGRYRLWLDGFSYDVEALDERTRAIRDLSASSTSASGPAPLIAPMPGLIVRVHVQVGDRVQQGQGLVVMEAMKMENELRAPSSGLVRAVAATPGTAVEKGARLIELE